MSNAYCNPDQINNPTDNPSFDQVLGMRLSRRGFMQVSVGSALAAGATVGLTGCASTGNGSSAGFTPVPLSTTDKVIVPNGYVAEVVYAWGDPVGSFKGMPTFKADGSNTAAEQALQAGMHHDGMWFFPFPLGSTNSDQGLLAVNHEYVDDGLLHPDGQATWTAEKVKKSQAAHGVSIVDMRYHQNQWNVWPSEYARRITAETPMKIAGPASGHALMKTNANPTGDQVNGTFANCANGHTPWGTYLTCEENWQDYFVTPKANALEKRYGINDKGAGYRWHEFDQRFNAAVEPNESNRFGWVVEIDPYDPNSTPVKRTALGRMGHEGAATIIAEDGRVVVYMGDDKRFEYIYKFVSRDKYDANNRAHNMTLLDHGTLYVAKFKADGSGEWIELTQGKNGLTEDKGFANQGDVVIKARQAGDVVGATPMDRPEWTTVHPHTREVFCTLTNNSERGKDGKPTADAANPRNNNLFGQIIRWKEVGGQTATKFTWNLFVQAGNPASSKPEHKGNIKGDVFGSPDGLWVDPRGLLWIQTDVSTSTLDAKEYAGMGNNQMLVADINTGMIKRFLTGPNGCEITGITMTPDMKTLFINIQHPGEPASERSDPANPLAVSAWPNGKGRPRSATVAIRRLDNGIVGS
ncbi:PhoX family phosphatase [Leeia sp. TBRC 13508]|uniref:PhoX family phosphatase n=1 Tax=Leeia speluncae TaxID=2884804 RepID=A0ABS8D898_9NEIS|nr:PhoX family phosphatase [Leeia speluncae]MCB6184401.1 PhoX family phosphatase [Leeia speluncae]